jgi:hypothetical protein
VETLFLGSADTMRRQALPFITQWMQGRSAKDMKLLDVAAGTGRFLTFVRDNFPVRLCTSCIQFTHSLKTPGFNPCALSSENLGFKVAFKCNNP